MCIVEGMKLCGRTAGDASRKAEQTIEEVVRVTQTDEVMAETTEEAEPGDGGRSG
jgi:hypothetical protein